MKVCPKCRVEKPLSEFYPRPDRKSGVRSKCKQCEVQAGCAYKNAHPEQTKAHQLKFRQAHRAEAVARAKKWALDHPDRVRDRHAKYYLEHREELLRRTAVTGAIWFRAHRGRARAYLADRRARKLQATPAWANRFFIDEIYHLAALRTKLLGYQWDVDHIIPLRGRLVSGLHVEGNLQVIPHIANCSKGNRFDVDAPEDIRRQMEQQAGFEPSQLPPMAPAEDVPPADLNAAPPPQ